ncbi:MAG: Cys-tRNA(Pro) deacylase [Gammaproteobacteria bacterium]|nr:Cys-tRNA(Pro) deacylase [Gammaproteobacteria bacterium]MBJ54919.1 Cys-tRNA(Pro) deacylase [Gammaproteobacteria bacterium]HBN14422.1 Cys-tRNA(Pro) deacylase [Pseudohongiella sp.]|tara:strand:- start:546 stop:1013 length:468 start_codon:yes stop_codon:yes gene_type:complete
MTPGIDAASKAGIKYRIHEYTHDPAHASYGLEAAEKMQVSPDRVFKTLVAALDTRELLVAVIPVSTSLNMKLLAKAAGGKKAAMAEVNAVQRSTGYVLGGVSPLGQKKRLRTFIDTSATDFATIFVSAGKRGLEIELSPNDLKTLTAAQFAALSA